MRIEISARGLKGKPARGGEGSATDGTHARSRIELTVKKTTRRVRRAATTGDESNRWPRRTFV